MKIILLFTFFLSCANSYAQCENKWIKKDIDKIDTILLMKNCLNSDGICLNNIDFNKVISQYRTMATDSFMSGLITNRIDSLTSMPKDSIVLMELEYLHNELLSRFWNIEVDNIGYAIYNTDTIMIDNNEIVVYSISSNFKTLWNEDNDNWFFCYTREYGIIYGEFVCIWNDGYPCFTTMTLLKNCLINELNKNLFERIKSYVLKTKFKR